MQTVANSTKQVKVLVKRTQMCGGGQDGAKCQPFADCVKGLIESGEMYHDADGWHVKPKDGAK